MTATRSKPANTPDDLASSIKAAIHDPAQFLPRIAEALNDPATSGFQLSALSELTQAAELAAVETAAAKRQAALDPNLPQDEVSGMLAEALAAEFNAERLRAAKERLTAASFSRWDAESIADQEAAYLKAEAGRDRCAEQLEAKWLGIQKAVVEVLADLMATNELVDATNRNQPDGKPILQRPEGMARGFHDRDNLTLSGGAPYNHGIVRLVQTVLPDFAAVDTLAWPPGISLNRVRRMGVSSPIYGAVLAAYRAASPQKGQ